MLGENVVERSAGKWITGGGIEIDPIGLWINVGVEPAVDIVLTRAKL
jgi:hypothetical protein